MGSIMLLAFVLSMNWLISMSNKKLKQLIESVDLKVDDAKNNTQLLSAVKKLIDYGSPIEYDYTVHKSLGILGIVGFFINMGVLFVPSMVEYILFNEDYKNLIFSIALLLIGVIPFIIMGLKTGSLDDLSRKIFNKDKIQDNDLKPIGLNNSYFNILQTNFPNNFNKGNYSRDFRFGYNSENGRFYNFHYVNSHTRMVPVTTTTTDSQGNSSTTTTMQQQTTYSHYDRYGFTFEIKKLNQVELSKGLIEKFQDITYTYVDGLFCVEVDDNLLRSKHRRIHGVDSPKEFLEELKGHTEMEYMEALLEIKKFVINS
jgi:hypothetical protein